MTQFFRHFLPDHKTNSMAFQASIAEDPTYRAYNQDIGMVNFYFQQSSVLQFKRAMRMTTIDYISQIGGLLGLGIGFSLVSGVEMVYWLTLRFVDNLRRHKSTARPTSGTASTALSEESQVTVVVGPV